MSLLILAAIFRSVAPTDSAVTLVGTPSVVASEAGVQFGRPLKDFGGSGLTADSPGARIRFLTDSGKSVVTLFYTGAHHRMDALNGITILRLDDGQPQAIAPPKSRPGSLKVEVNLPGMPRLHSVEVLLPYGDSVAFTGLDVESGARVEPWPMPRRIRWVAYGDSITHGFRATDVMHTYPFLVAEAKGWNALNFGVGSRKATVEDGPILAAQPAEIFTLLIGVNDFYAHTSRRPSDNSLGRGEIIGV